MASSRGLNQFVQAGQIFANFLVALQTAPDRLNRNRLPVAKRFQSPYQTGPVHPTMSAGDLASQIRRVKGIKSVFCVDPDDILSNDVKRLDRISFSIGG